MKKQCLLLICAISFAFLGNSQDLTSKKGESMLPEAGDYALGFNAAPFLNYVGNLMNSGANTSPTADFMTGYDAAITGKYFKDAQNAYRGSVRIGLGSNTETETNGDEMKSEDVLFSFNRSMDMGLGFSYLIKSLVEGMSTPDDNTFVINVNAAQATFLGSMTRIPIVNKSQCLANKQDGDFGENGDYCQEFYYIFLKNDA